MSYDVRVTMRIFAYANMLLSDPSLTGVLSLSLLIDEELKKSDDLVKGAEAGTATTLDNELSKAIEKGWYRESFVCAHTSTSASQQCLFSHCVLAPDGVQT